MLKYTILKDAIKTDRHSKTILSVLTFLLFHKFKHPNTLEVINVNWYDLDTIDNVHVKVTLSNFQVVHPRCVCSTI